MVFFLMGLGISLLAESVFRANKHAEETLFQANAYNRSLLEACLDPLVTISVDGMIMDVNEATLGVTGAPREQLIGSNFCDYFTEPEQANTGYQRVFSQGHVTNYPLAIRHVSGKVTEVLYNASIYRNQQGEVAGVFAAARDVTDRKLAEQKLQASLYYTRSLIEASLDLMVTISMEGKIISVNEATVQITGIDRDQLIDSDFSRYFSEPEKVRAAHQKALTKDFVIEVPLAIKHASGEIFDVLYNASPYYTQSGEMAGIFGVARNITERKQAEEQLRLAASVFTHAREGIMITTTDGTIIDVNDAFSRITSYGRDEVLGQNPRLLSSGRQDKNFYSAMWTNLIEKGHWYGEIWNRRKSGEVYALMHTISAVSDHQGKTKHYVAMFSDITLLKDHENELERMAHYDALTSLPNRVLLADRMRQGMAQAKRRSRPLAIAFLDLDGFKTINDDCGHEAGDQLLITLSDRMKQTLREGDTLARLGGDEFVAVLLDLADETTSEPLLNRLLAAAAQPVEFGNIILQVSASLGVTFYPQVEDIDADQLLRQADQAMYQAKQAGKNRYHLFDALLDRNIRSHYETLDRIRYALTAGEFVLFYQPKVDMRTGAVIGAEALIRWQHPEKGLLPPAVFLPVIEEHSLAIDIGEWVIGTALAQMELWQVGGLKIPVSVNVSARQLLQADFVVRLSELLAAHPNVKHGDLELEVLETSAMEDLVKASGVIDACRKLGVSFALDDFGTGYSSLTYLKRLPVSMLKIDQSFVRDMLDDPDDLAILEGILGMALAFRLKVIAEGVETVEHGTLLLQLGCDLAQGYGIARPMPADQLLGWVDTWQPDPVWAELPFFSRDYLPMFFACVEHRSWIAAMERYLKGEHETPMPLDIHECRFGKWLDTDGLSRYGWLPSFSTIEKLHRQVHELATELCRLHNQDRDHEAALTGLDELHNLRDALLNQLKALAKEIRQ